MLVTSKRVESSLTDVLRQGFLNFFALWAPKSQKCPLVPFEDPKIQERVVYLGTVLYFCELYGPLDPLHGPLRGPWTPG